MLFLAAALLIAVTAMHSILGELRLIGPILRIENLPVILGSRRNTRATIRIAWHLTSLFWLCLAALLVRLQLGTGDLAVWFLWSVTAAFALSGAAALIVSRGRHLSWVFFLPIAVLCGTYAAGL